MCAFHVGIRREVYLKDAKRIAHWMEDDEVTRYLNEEQDVSDHIRKVASRMKMPILTHVFNKDGSFYVITEKEDRPVGFLRLVEKPNAQEMVVVIGARHLWGKGLGKKVVDKGLQIAFFEKRARKVIAKIHVSNRRSIRAFQAVGFSLEKKLTKENQYAVTMQQYINMV